MEPLFTEQELQQSEARYQQALERCPARREEIEAFLAALGEEEQQAMRFVVGNMPLSDLVAGDLAVISGEVCHALRARRELSYAASVPAGLFRNYVLFYRVNNENIEPHRAAFYQELAPRVQGKTMQEAALEVNHWCFEKATYQAADERTASPVTVLRRGYGRCGEESTLTVEAMRSVGIPARQCYAPRWAHCDDNHAWVEIWAEDGWHYLGACEPEAVLDKGWFTSAASRAILVHSRAFSQMVPGEEIVEQTPVYTTVNNIRVYAQSRRLYVHVLQDGKPLAGAIVRFELVNYAELYPLYIGVTGEDGTVQLLAGMGSLYLHVSANGKYLNRLVDLREEGEVTVEMAEAVSVREGVEEFDMVPPEGKIPGAAALTPEQEARHEERLVQAEKQRQEHESSWFTPETAKEKMNGRAGEEEFVRALVNARGNYEEILSFINDSRFPDEEKAEMLSTLREKDFADTPAAVLAEYLTCARVFREKFPHDLYVEGILAPRIHNEMILPVRPGICDFFAQKGIEFSDACAVADYLRENMTLLDEYEYSDLVADARAVLRCGVCATLSLKTLFVAACRALGFPARLNPVTGVPEYGYEGAFRPLPVGHTLTCDAETVGACEQGSLTLVNESGREMNYFQQYSVARLTNGAYESLVMWGEVLRDRQTLSVEPGEYRVLTSARQIDGSVLVRAYFVRVEAGKETVLPIALRPDRIREKLHFAELPMPELLPLVNGDQPMCEGRQHVLAFLEPGKEPTEHLLNELIELRDAYVQAKLPVRFVVFHEKALENRKLNLTLESLSEVQVMLCRDRAALRPIREALHVGDERLPLAVAVDKDGKGLFAFANYNVGTAGTLLDIFKAV